MYLINDVYLCKKLVGAVSGHWDGWAIKSESNDTSLLSKNDYELSPMIIILVYI